MAEFGTDENQTNSMLASEHQSLQVAEAFDHYFEISAMMATQPMPFVEREDFLAAPDIPEIAILAVEQPMVSMIDPASGSVITQTSDFIFTASAEVDASGAVASNTIPANSGEIVASTSAVAAGLD
jgi:hypothetical protein